MKNDIFYILLFITVVLIGLFSLIKMPVLLLPSYEEKVLSIITEYYGMEPLIIEEIITKPIEIALKDITGIKNIYSYSSRGKSKILVYLEKNEDINKKSVLIKDAISKVSILFPEECHQPAVYRYNTDDQPVMIFSVYSSTISNKDLFSYIDSFLKKKILAIEGVANVEIYGRSNDEYFISLYEDAIFHSNIDYRMIFQNIVSNSINIPISKSYSENSKIQINFPNKFTNMFDIKKLKFPSEKNNSGKNQLINSEDILTIEKKEKENDRISLVNNKDTLTVLIYKKSNASILNISHNVRKIINNERKIFSYDIISDQGIVFSNLLTQLKYTIVISLLIVLSLTYLFFRNKIYLFLIGFSIPVSIFSSLTALAFSKSSLNIMTLSGIIIGIGTCLDNSIVMVEFIEYNLNNFNDIDDILSKSVYSSYRSLIASTLTTIIVFIPFFFIGMRQQQLYQDFAISISIILIVSCAYSILFIPAVIKRLSISYPEKIFNILQTKENKKVKLNILKRNSLMFLIKLKKEKENYIKQSSNLIKKTLINVKNVKTQIIIAFFLIACAIATILFFMTFSEEISPMTEKEFTVYFEFEPKYSNDYKYDKMIEIGQLLEKVRYNSIIYSRLEGTLCTIYFKFPIDEKKFKEKTGIIKNYIKNIKRNDGFFYFQEGKNSKEKSFKIYFLGDNIEKLNKYVDKCAQDIGNLKGVTTILKGYKNGGPQITFRLKPEEMYFYGINDIDVIQYLRACFYFPVIMKFYEDKNLMDVRQKVELKDFKLSNLGSLRIWNYKKESPIYLEKISTFNYDELPAMICRKNGKRFISLDVRYENKTIEQLNDEIKRILKNENKPIDFYYEFDEEYEELKENQRNFIFIIILVIYLIYATLAIILKSFKTPIIIILFTPSIFMGGLLFLKISGYGLSIPVYLASIVSAGYVVNILILIIEEINSLRYGHKISILDGILIAYKNKIKSIFLATSTTIGSIFPLFFLAGSSDFFLSLSGTFLFSILSGTILPLIFFPFFSKLKIIEKIMNPEILVR